MFDEVYFCGSGNLLEKLMCFDDGQVRQHLDVELCRSVALAFD